MTETGPPREGADLIVCNGRIITCDAGFRFAAAVAVKDGRIAAIGGGDEVAALADDATRVIDAGGRAVIPGLIDGHAHMDREGLKDIFPSLAGCQSIDDICGRIEALADAAAPGQWIVTMPIGEPPYYLGVPGNLRDKRFPTRWELDQAAPDNPVYIRPIWGYWRHVQPLDSIANSRALELAGIGPGMAPPPQTIKFETDPGSNEFNGIIHEWTFMPVAELTYFTMMPKFDHGHRVAGLKRAMAAYNAYGTTSVYEEHGCAQELIDAYRAVHKAGEATVRAALVYSPAWLAAGHDDYTATLEGWADTIGGHGQGDDWLRIAGIFADLGNSPDDLLRAGAGPYTGWAGFNYDSGVPAERMTEFLVAAARADIRVNAIWMSLLEFYQAADEIVPLDGRRWVIGHLGNATPDQIGILRDLGIAMSAHPNRHVYKSGHLTREKIGRANENQIAPYKSVREAGIHLALSTDNVPVSLFYPIWQAVSRTSMYSSDAIAPDQALSRREALLSATIEGAWLTAEEDIKGSLETGKLADMAILTDDPLTCPEHAIKDIAAATTIVGGRVVYERDAA
jgi:predicted amidohydrolase YtcJ